MGDEILFVKNMVCHRCSLAVENVLALSAIPFREVKTGEIGLAGKLNNEQYQKLARDLMSIGLELIETRKSTLVEKIRRFVIKKARNDLSEADSKASLSSYLSKNLHHEYTYLSSLFSSVEGRTIESYFILQRIEKVKELLVYNEMSLSQIALEMGYSSVSHLSNQFKKITGLKATHFRQVGSAKRKLLDQV